MYVEKERNFPHVTAAECLVPFNSCILWFLFLTFVASFSAVFSRSATLWDVLWSFLLMKIEPRNREEMTLAVDLHVFVPLQKSIAQARQFSAHLAK